MDVSLGVATIADKGVCLALGLLIVVEKWSVEQIPVAYLILINFVHSFVVLNKRIRICQKFQQKYYIKHVGIPDVLKNKDPSQKCKMYFDKTGVVD